MPIAAVCGCGTRLKVADTAAGKRVKCPRCGSAVAVPAVEFEYEVVDDEPTPKGKARQAFADDDEPRPTKKRSRASDDDEDGEDDRPRKRSKGGRRNAQPRSNLPLLLGVVGVLAVALAGVVVAVVVLTAGNQNPVASGGTPTRPEQPPPTSQPQPPPPPPTTQQRPQQPPDGGQPGGWSTFQGEGFHVEVPNGSQFKHTPQPSDIPFFGQREKIWMSHKAATPGQPVYAVSVVKLNPAQQDEYKKNPDLAWKKIVRVTRWLPLEKYQYQKDVVVSGADAREYTFPVDPALYGFVRVIVQPEAGWIFSCSLIASTPVTGSEPMVKPFLDSFTTDQTALPSFPSTTPTDPTPQLDSDGWKVVKGEGFSIKMPESDNLFPRTSIIATKSIARTGKVWATTDPKNPTKHKLMLGVEVWNMTQDFTLKMESKPAEAWDEVFMAMRLVVQSDPRGRPTMKEATLGGKKGREMVFLDEGVYESLRCVAHKGKIYVVILHRFRDDSDKPITKCFDSFKLDD